MPNKVKTERKFCPSCERMITVKRFVGEICRDCDSSSRAAHMSDKFSPRSNDNFQPTGTVSRNQGLLG